MKHCWSVVSGTHALPQNCAARKISKFCVQTYTFRWCHRSKTGKKEKNKWDDWCCESVCLVHGSSQQGITSCKRLFSSTSSSWNMDAKCRSFRWLTLDHTRSAQRRCRISECLPRLAELVPIGAEGLPRLVMSPHPFCLGLLQLLFSVWLSIFNLFFHTKRRN